MSEKKFFMKVKEEVVVRESNYNFQMAVRTRKYRIYILGKEEQIYGKNCLDFFVQTEEKC